MRFLSRWVFADEFAIDMKPLPVYQPDAPAEGDPATLDLLTALSDMLRDQERLRELNAQLREMKGDDGELDAFIRRFLGRMDGFDRVLEAFRSMEPSEEVNNWLKSLEGLYFKIQDDLVNFGLEPIDSMGKRVDLNYMDVVDYRPALEYQHNTVIQEVKRGYRYKGKVLRDAQVVVAFNERGK